MFRNGGNSCGGAGGSEAIKSGVTGVETGRLEQKIVIVSEVRFKKLPRRLFKVPFGLPIALVLVRIVNWAE